MVDPSFVALSNFPFIGLMNTPLTGMSATICICSSLMYSLMISFMIPPNSLGFKTIPGLFLSCLSNDSISTPSMVCLKGIPLLLYVMQIFGLAFLSRMLYDS